MAEGGDATSSKPKDYTEEKAGKTKIPKIRKKPQEAASSRTKNEEKIKSDPRAPKMATESSNRLKSVFEKLKNFFLLSKMKSTIPVRKLMTFSFQENLNRNN